MGRGDGASGNEPAHFGRAFYRATLAGRRRLPLPSTLPAADASARRLFHALKSMPIPLTLYDNYARALRTFEPLQHGARVGLYTCGPTVYDYQHIGNYRTFLFEDTLRRVLEWNGFSVMHVMNVTDVGHLVSDADTGEDKMEKGARRTGKTAWEIAALYTDAFLVDLKLLNIEDPTILCRATDHIADQIAFIADIEKNGYTYRTSDGIYFDTSKQPDYGHLARLDIEGLEAGKRVDLGEKRHPTDFALWKFSPPGEKRQMEWDSPLGPRLSRLAHRVLGDGAALPWRFFRHPLRRRGSHSRSPHERDRADRGARRHASRQFLDAWILSVAEGRQDGEVGRRVSAPPIADRTRLRSARISV